MMFSHSVDRQVDHLQKDLSKVVRDLGRLSGQLVKFDGTGEAITSHVPRDLKAKARSNLEAFGEGFRDTRRIARKYLGAVGSQLRKRPYQLALGTLCTGIVVGALIPLGFRKS